MRRKILEYLPATHVAVVRAVTPVSVIAPLVVALGMAGCNTDKVPTYEPFTDPAKLYMRLALDHAAITMATTAPSNTLQLVATPRDALDSVMSGLPAPTYSLLVPGDSVNVTVSPDGLVTALQPATDVKIIADLAVPGNVRHADTATVNVTGTPQEVATFSIQATGADSNRLSLYPPPDFSDPVVAAPFFTMFYMGGLVPRLDTRVRALDAAGNPISGLVVEYRSLDPDTATVERWPTNPTDGAAIRPFREGHVRMVAQAMVYGVEKADTVTFTITAPAITYVPVRSTPGTTSLFGPRPKRIRRNGVVMWLNALDRPVNLVFDDPTNVVQPSVPVCDTVAFVFNQFTGSSGVSYCNGGGNIALVAPADATPTEIYKTVQVRQFPQPGAYAYHDEQTGTAGAIVVTDGPSD